MGCPLCSTPKNSRHDLVPLHVRRARALHSLSNMMQCGLFSDLMGGVLRPPPPLMVPNPQIFCAPHGPYYSSLASPAAACGTHKRARAPAATVTPLGCVSFPQPPSFAQLSSLPPAKRPRTPQGARHFVALDDGGCLAAPAFLRQPAGAVTPSHHCAVAPLRTPPRAAHPSRAAEVAARGGGSPFAFSSSSSSSSSGNNPQRQHPQQPQQPVKTGRWTKREDEKLRLTIEALDASALRSGGAVRAARDWSQIACAAFGFARTETQCAERYEKVLKLGLVKGPWSAEEDETVRAAMQRQLAARNATCSSSSSSSSHESSSHASPVAVAPHSANWGEIAKLLPGRLTKQVRERWQNHLDPSLLKTPWSAEEDFLLVSLQALLGNRWNEIARAFRGRSENAIKNRWNSKQRRRFLDRDAHDTTTGTAAAAAHATPKSSSLPSSSRKTKQSLRARSSQRSSDIKCAGVDFHGALMTAFGDDHELEIAASILVHSVAAARS